MSRHRGFAEAAVVLGLEATRRNKLEGAVDGFEVQAFEAYDERRSWFEARVYVDQVSLPVGLEVRPWMKSWFSRVLRLPFGPGYRTIECAGGNHVAVVARKKQSRDAWLTEENTSKACAFSNVLTHEGFLKGRQYFEYRSKPVDDPALIVSAVTSVLEDARLLHG